jgi:hypothetical protein
LIGEFAIGYSGIDWLVVIGLSGPSASIVRSR